MNNEGIINAAEKRNIPWLEKFFNEKWGTTRLWSHDLSHHQRVWKYAKELFSAEGKSPDPVFTGKLLIACYLHDSGMSVDKGEKHGRQSRAICEEYLNSTGKRLSDYTDMLEAVEAHDEKEYSGMAGKNSLHLLLTVADDLDAFGHTGILRYFEIYTRRGYSVHDLCPLVLKNAESRYNNFTRHFGSHEDLVKKHSKRYRMLRDFFRALYSEISL